MWHNNKFGYCRTLRFKGVNFKFLKHQKKNKQEEKLDIGLLFLSVQMEYYINRCSTDLATNIEEIAQTGGLLDAKE